MLVSTFSPACALVPVVTERFRKRCDRRTGCPQGASALSEQSRRPRWIWGTMSPAWPFALPVLAYTERMIVSLRQQSDVLGPQLTLTSAMGHRQLAERLARPRRLLSSPGPSPPMPS